VVGGHNRYYGVPENQQALASFRFQVARRWWRTLQRRGNRKLFCQVMEKRHLYSFDHIDRLIRKGSHCKNRHRKREGVFCSAFVALLAHDQASSIGVLESINRFDKLKCLLEFRR
jgi:hypothetical protein